MASTGDKIKGFLKYYKTPLIVITCPLLLLPLPLTVDGLESRGGFILLLMGIYWCTEAIPIGVTSLIPLVLVPLFGITPAKDVCNSYLSNPAIMMMGGLIMAIAVENSNLHIRIALKVLLTVGDGPRWLVLGAMVPTWFLSMWINNTAATAMMMPIVEEIIKTLENLSQENNIEINEHLPKMSQNATTINVDPEVKESGFPCIESTDDIMYSLMLKKSKKSGKYKNSYTVQDKGVNLPKKLTNNNSISRLSRALTISVAYAANCGGVSTVIGAPANTILMGQADDIWKQKGCGDSPINFVSWMVMGMPVAFINLFVIWVWLEIFFVGWREFLGCSTKPHEKERQAVGSFLETEYEKLGSMSVAERQCSVLFVIMVLLWFFRKPGFMPGWDSLFNGYTSDATPAIFMAVLLFVIPEQYEVFSDIQSKPLVTWQSMKDKFPWEIMLLLGGGIALAEAVMMSGLSEWIGHQLSALQVLPGPLLIAILGILVSLVTQFSINTACATLLLPIAAVMAENLDKNPLYLMIPVTIGVQYAFMLPVATPPNAVAFQTGRISVLDMVKAGAFLNIACTFVMTLGTFTWGMAYFDLDTIPWDKCANTTNT